MRRDKPSSEAPEEYARPSEAEQREKLRLEHKSSRKRARGGGGGGPSQLTQLTGPSLSHKSTAPLSYDTQHAEIGPPLFF